MYNENRIKDLIDNGIMIRSTQKAIKDLDDIVENLEQQINQCPMFVPEMILRRHLVMVKEQRKTLSDKLECILRRRQEIQKNIFCDEDVEANESIEIIDRIVAKLLAIDDIYAETHKSSNVSIMLFVEDLLKKKRSLLTK